MRRIRGLKRKRTEEDRERAEENDWGGGPPAEARQRERHDAIAGWTATDSAPTSVGLRVSKNQPYEPHPIPYQAYGELENDRTMSFSRPTRSATN